MSVARWSSCPATEPGTLKSPTTMNWQSSKVSWSNRSDSSARHDDVTSPGGRYTQTTTMDWWWPTILTLNWCLAEGW